ncbi:hypothetical protein ACJRO7_022020 [Eucalyptus globulus]|uniref:Uncharacterized protein n=1 Tax=Eucalyptus globulus TaxID=34317 RepID=A0ABD3KU72_EUCGL
MPRINVTVLLSAKHALRISQEEEEEEEEDSWAALNHWACKSVHWVGPPLALIQTCFGPNSHSAQPNPIATPQRHFFFPPPTAREVSGQRKERGSRDETKLRRR